MRKYETLDQLFSATCNAIREKDGTSALIKHQDIPDRIMGIGVGGGVEAFPYTFYTYSGSGMKLENMVASNFSANSAVFLSEPFLPGDATWEIGVKFTWPEKLSKYANVLFGSWNNDFYKCPTLEVGSNRDLMKVVAAVPDGSSAWNHIGNYEAQVTPGESYWTIFRFDGEKYVVSLSEDGQAFEDIIQIDYGVMYQDATNSKLQFGGINRSNNHYFEGSIDLKETYIKIGDQTWLGRG